MTDMTDAQLARAILRGLHENWQRMARRNQAEANSSRAERLLRETAGLRHPDDGLAAQRKLRREWDREPLIAELDCVVLTRDLPSVGLKAGDVGTVVLVHRDGAAYEVEFVSLDGETIALETLKPADIRRGEHEILHTRNIA